MAQSSSRSLTAMMRSVTLGSTASSSSSSRSTIASSSRRMLSTSAPRREEAAASPSSSSAAYPFSSQVRALTPPSPKSGFTPLDKVNHPHRAVLPYVHHQLKAHFDPNDRLTALFHRKSPDCIPVGSVVIVESWTTPEKTGVTTFSGVLMGIRRRGTSTSFVLRNLISKLGVEVRFNVYSPLLKDVRIVAKAEAGKDKKGGLKRTRRAKLYCE